MKVEQPDVSITGKPVSNSQFTNKHFQSAGNHCFPLILRVELQIAHENRRHHTDL